MAISVGQEVEQLKSSGVSKISVVRMRTKKFRRVCSVLET